MLLRIFTKLLYKIYTLDIQMKLKCLFFVFAVNDNSLYNKVQKLNGDLDQNNL